MRRSIWLAAAALGLLVGACAPAQDFSDLYRRYEQSFADRHSYRVHAIDRDGAQLHAREFTPAAAATGSAGGHARGRPRAGGSR